MSPLIPDRKNSVARRAIEALRSVGSTGSLGSEDRDLPQQLGLGSEDPIAGVKGAPGGHPHRDDRLLTGEGPGLRAAEVMRRPEDRGQPPALSLVASEERDQEGVEDLALPSIEGLLAES